MSRRTQNSPVDLSLPEAVKYSVSATILLLGVGVAFGLYMLKGETGKVESTALIPLVETASVNLFDGDLDMMVSGNVVPFREITLAAEVGGKIAAKHCDCEAGNFIKAGSTLLEIESTDYELELKTIEAEIKQAQKTYEETQQEIAGAENNLKLAASEYKLEKTRFQRSERLRSSISQTQYDQARSALIGAETQYVGRKNTLDMLMKRKERLQASLDLTLSRKERAELNLARTVVKAPVDGVVVREAVEQGDFVMAARELIVFEDTSRAEVLCNLTPGELDWLRKYAPEESLAAGDSDNRVYNLPKVPVRIFDQSDPGVFWDGILDRFDGIGRNETTKSIPCRIVVDKPVVEGRGGQRVLVRGMFVKCRIVLPSQRGQRQLASFPSVALRPGDYIWVVRDGKLSRFDVNVIDRTPYRESMSEEKMVVVEFENSGLAIDEQVVVSPLPQPTEGGRVLTEKDDGSEKSASAESDDVGESKIPKQAARTSEPQRSEP